MLQITSVILAMLVLYAVNIKIDFDKLLAHYSSFVWTFLKYLLTGPGEHLGLLNVESTLIIILFLTRFERSKVRTKTRMKINVQKLNRK